MKVVYANGTEGILSEEDSKNLYISNRFTKESWQELEAEMLRLSIVKFADPFLSQVGGQLVSLEYVRTQISIR